MPFWSPMLPLVKLKQWMQSELRRIDPNCLNEGNEQARMRALEILALEMRNERDALNL